jgi:hypothetical protein
VLVISGHFAGTNFFSEEIETQEFLPVEEMERVSCSDSCPGLFSHLKEVYLFGCNTLNGETFESQTAEVARSLMKDGFSRSEAERQSRALNGRYGETNRDKMRRIFADVPVIYGFSAKAPIGPVAAGSLSRYLASGGAGEVGSGRTSARLLSSFGATSLTATSGVGNAGPQATHRREVCTFYDERRQPSDQVAFLHRLFDRNMTEVRLFLDHIEKFSSTLPDAERRQPAVASGLQAIAADRDARERYLAFARQSERPDIRARMVKLAGSFGWLDATQLDDELASVNADLLLRPRLTTADVDFVCTLNKDGRLDRPVERFGLDDARRADTGHSAALACLGSADDHQRQLAALASGSLTETEIAQVYFRQRPIRDASEIRAVATAVARLPDSEAKVVALETLARHYLSDPESIQAIASALPRSGSLAVERAIAGVLFRADLKSVDAPQLLRTLGDRRTAAGRGHDMIDALVRRLRAQSGVTTVIAGEPPSVRNVP